VWPGASHLRVFAAKRLARLSRRIAKILKWDSVSQRNLNFVYFDIPGDRSLIDLVCVVLAFDNVVGFGNFVFVWVCALRVRLDLYPATFTPIRTIVGCNNAPGLVSWFVSLSRNHKLDGCDPLALIHPSMIQKALSGQKWKECTEGLRKQVANTYILLSNGLGGEPVLSALMCKLGEHGNGTCGNIVVVIDVKGRCWNNMCEEARKGEGMGNGTLCCWRGGRVAADSSNGHARSRAADGA